MQKAVILAAGMARRLRPLTDERPKCLLTVGNRTLLQRTVDALVAVGTTELVVVTGYRAPMIRQFLTLHYPQLQLHFVHNERYEHTNNIYSLWLSRPWTDGHSFLLMDSDILCDPAIVARVASHSGAALAVQRHPLGEEEMKVVVDGGGRITAITKQCDPQKALGESVGIEKITPEYSTALFRELETMMADEPLQNVFYELAFERLIPKGHTFSPIDTTDLYSCELDTPDDFRLAQDSLPERLR